ncbi:nucleic-acid-binding protein from transposon X-element [Trichonephila clavipes]|uniref:Nucleic-acid-binding protein from transposon X-element n=1 Tax=Trichonephila clavipes TaxID=2585209 RepID=A0A8X6T620_TRICX|nr:nucleic-acid-binding protein from transposon X-element [Trichonephila clavipes]
MDERRKTVDRYRLEADDFLKNITTGDESWIHHNDPENNWQFTEYCNPSSSSVKVSVEPLNKSTFLPQYYRCQEFFHHSRFCTRAPKCLKCSGGHLTSECTKSAKAPAKCANCSGPHPANFSGCPKNPINTKHNKTKAKKNVWQERAAARKQSPKQTKPSFAEVVKGSNNNSLDAKEVMTKMAPR